MACKIGAITVGQSPRIDVVPEILDLLGQVTLIERGALDGLTQEEIESLAPQSGDYVLVTRLADGTSVHIAEKHILARIQMQIDDLIRQDVTGILMLCTGQFPKFNCSKPLLYPQILLQHFIPAILNDQTLGVLSPDISQIPQSTKRWHENGVKKVIVEAATPYGPPEAVLATAIKLKNQGADLIVLDCIGYTSAMKQAIKEHTQLPVILPRTVAARTVAEMFG